ncbi:MAG: hypothetical protein AAGA58_05290 [Verrucomicrobiota bacterium]
MDWKLPSLGVAAILSGGIGFLFGLKGDTHGEASPGLIDSAGEETDDTPFATVVRRIDGSVESAFQHIGIDRLFALTQALPHALPDETREWTRYVFDEMRGEDDWDDQQTAEAASLMLRWAELDREGFLEWVTNSEDEGVNELGIYYVLPWVDPESAVHLTLAKGTKEDVAFILEELAARDHALAQELAEKLSLPLSMEHFDWSSPGLTPEDFQSAIARLERENPDWIRDKDVRREVLRNLAKVDFDAAWAMGLEASRLPLKSERKHSRDFPLVHLAEVATTGQLMRVLPELPPSGQKTTLVKEMMKRLLGENPDNARHWAESLENRAERWQALTQVSRHAVAEGDYDLLGEILRDNRGLLDYRGVQYRVHSESSVWSSMDESTDMRTVLRNYAYRSPETALDLALDHQLRGADGRGELFTWGIGKLVQDDPQQAAAWLAANHARLDDVASFSNALSESHSDPFGYDGFLDSWHLNKFTRPLVDGLAGESMESAYALADSMPANSPLGHAVRVAVAESLARDNLGTALAYISDLGENEDFARKSVFASVLERDPRAALHYLDQILRPPGSKPDSSHHITYSSALYSTPGVAREFFEATRAMGDDWVVTNKRVLSGTLENWLRADLTEGSAWIAEMPPGPARDVPIGELVSVLAHSENDPATAFVWANEILDPATREQKLVEAGEVFFQFNPTEAQRLLPPAILEKVETSIAEKRNN